MCPEEQEGACFGMGFASSNISNVLRPESCVVKHFSWLGGAEPFLTGYSAGAGEVDQKSLMF